MLPGTSYIEDKSFNGFNDAMCKGFYLDKMYPGLKNLPFDDFISKYLPKLDDFGEDHFIKNFMTVNYTTVLDELKYFGDRLILVDGTEFKDGV